MRGQTKKQPPSGSVNIKQVAAELGVSLATVSRALSHPHLLRAETRERVLAAIDRLGYQPNLIARDLRLRESRLVFVVVPSLSPFFLEVFRGVERGAREGGYTVLMGHSERDPSREQLFLDQVASRRADGVILVTSAEPGLMAARKRHMPPVVAALETIEGQAFPTVRVDHRKASMDATNHLLALGHRRIAHIAGPQKSPMAAHRLEGFQAAMAAAGLDATAYPQLAGNFTVAFGEEAMEALLACNPPPTAVFAANDEMAVGAIQTIKRAGLQVGRDVSVIGFDDQRIASLYEPSLTTIKVPTEELGYRSMLSLWDLLRGRPAEEDTVLQTSLIIRSTTGPPPG
ncbi:LacI family DNA-binding transcriptional regulator [Caulobacter sp. CCG-8]|uniref:substrate-binding domain-containing protein n=1 Tax=Caulobacter sp. CCG-8 TaxID=3127958 RepID=UPI0009DF5FF5